MEKVEDQKEQPPIFPQEKKKGKYESSVFFGPVGGGQ